MQTIFEKIIEGSLPSYKVYEDEYSYAFLTLKANTIGHTLVVPRKPYKDIYDIPQDELQNLIVSVQNVAKLLREKLVDCVGVNIGQNNESAAGQEIFYLHFHVIPRYTDDGLIHWTGHELEEFEAKKVLEMLK